MQNLLHFLLIDSSYPINTRNEKIIFSLKRVFPHLSVSFITWNRDGRVVADTDKGMPIYNKKSGYGKIFQKLINLWGYFRFLKGYNEKTSPLIIIASHWDMLFLASIFKKRRQILVYENLDIPTSSNKLVLFILKQVETFALKKTDAIIFASRFFEDLYKHFDGCKMIIENKPLIRNVSTCLQVPKENNVLIISYIGLVRYADILKNLIDAVKDNNSVILYIHGEGQDLSKLRNYAAEYSNVKFTGRFGQADLPRLYSSSDIIWAVYPNKDYNVKYAISNKFHESIEYKVPCIYSNNTKLGDFVEYNHIGLTVDPYSVHDIKALVNLFVQDKTILERLKDNLFCYSQTEKGWNEEFRIFEQYIKSLQR